MGYARVELRLGVVDALPYARAIPGPSVDASASAAAAPGSAIGSGLELRGIGRYDGAGVVPGVDSGGRVELYASADDGISGSVSVGVRCRSCSVERT